MFGSCDTTACYSRPCRLYRTRLTFFSGNLLRLPRHRLHQDLPASKGSLTQVISTNKTILLAILTGFAVFCTMPVQADGKSVVDPSEGMTSSSFASAEDASLTAPVDDPTSCLPDGFFRRSESGSAKLAFHSPHAAKQVSICQPLPPGGSPCPPAAGRGAETQASNGQLLRVVASL
jgi:hypothetical protein